MTRTQHQFRLFGGALIASVALANSAAHAQLAISPAVNYSVGLQPSGVTAGDFDGDGDLDLATTTDAPDKINILLNSGAGTYTAGPTIFLPNSSSPDQLRAGDLDGDGIIDIAVVLRDFNQVMALTNNGAMNFTSIGTSATGAEPRGMDLADVDGDGDLDIVMANRSGNTATFLRNGGTGTYTATTLAAGTEPRDAKFGDFNNDGQLDIAISNHDDRTVSVYTNGGDSFSLSATLFVGAQDRPDGLATGDLNGDGIDDLVAISGDDTLALNRVVRFLSNGASFAGPTYFATGALNSSSVVAADLDCDGDVDLAVTNQDGASVSMLVNSGTGAFGAPSIMTVGTTPEAILAADLTNDGDLDLAIANRDSSNISVLLNDCGTGEPVCGNGICEQGEDNANCPGDCPPTGPICGNGVCEPGESSATCPGDCGGGGQPGAFAFSAVSFAAGVQPSGVAAGDFNGDGLMDLASTADVNQNADNVAILLANGTGGYSAPVYVFLPNSSSPDAIVAGDLDGNGTTDLAVVLRDLNQVIALINGGAANFTLGATAPTGAEPRGMDIADADNDKDLDLVVANRTGNSVSILLNNGNATFASATLPAGLEPRDAEWGDFNSDGIMEIAVSNHDDRTIGIYQSTGSAYALGTTLSVGPVDRPDGLVAADLNGDGRDDLATASGDDTPALNRAVVFMATDTGFSGPAFFPLGTVINASDIAAGDFDCDGDVDLATSNQDSNNVSVIANDGAGVFSAAVVTPVGTRPDRLIAVDVSGDGSADIVTANRDSNDLTVLTNTAADCQGPVLGDVTGNGIVDVDDLLAVINGWGACPAKGACPADIAPLPAGDGQINVDDLLMVINNWS